MRIQSHIPGAISSMTAVNASQMKISCNPVETLVAFSLGSGIGAAIHDPVSGAGGILNFILPDSSKAIGVDPAKAPFMFADTGIRAFITALNQHGIQPARSKIVIAGGAHILNQTEMFNIGQKNCEAVQRFLNQHHLNIHYEDTGGTISRTLSLEIGSGCSSIKVFGRGELKV